MVRKCKLMVNNMASQIHIHAQPALFNIVQDHIDNAKCYKFNGRQATSSYKKLFPHICNTLIVT